MKNRLNEGFSPQSCNDLTSSGINYNFKKGTFLTNEVNPVFACIADLAAITEDPKNKQGSRNAALSRLVGRVGQDSNNGNCSIFMVGGL